jgi:hypothetical protein
MNMTGILNLTYDKEANIYIITSEIIPGFVVEDKDKEKCIEDALELALHLIGENGINETNNI